MAFFPRAFCPTLFRFGVFRTEGILTRYYTVCHVSRLVKHHGYSHRTMDCTNIIFPKFSLHVFSCCQENLINSKSPTHTSSKYWYQIVGSSVFAQLMAESPYTLQLTAHFPLKIAPSHGAYEPQSNIWFTGLQPKWHLSNCLAIYAQLTVERRYTLQWAALSPSKLPLPMAGSRPNLIHDSLGSSKPTIQTASRLVQPFLHSSPQSVPTLQLAAPSPPQKCPFPRGIWIPI